MRPELVTDKAKCPSGEDHDSVTLIFEGTDSVTWCECGRVIVSTEKIDRRVVFNFGA